MGPARVAARLIPAAADEPAGSLPGRAEAAGRFPSRRNTHWPVRSAVAAAEGRCPRVGSSEGPELSRIARGCGGVRLLTQKGGAADDDGAMMGCDVDRPADRRHGTCVGLGTYDLFACVGQTLALYG